MVKKSLAILTGLALFAGGWGCCLGWQRSRQNNAEITRQQNVAVAVASGTVSEIPTTSDWPKFTGSAQELLEKYEHWDSANTRSYFLFRTLHEMPPGRLPLLAAELSTMKTNRFNRDAVLEAVAGLWVEQDSKAALAWAKNLPDEIRDVAMTSVLTAISSKKLDFALQELTGLKANLREQIVERIADQLELKDPAVAIALLLKQENAGLTYGVYLRFERWGKKAPEAAAAALTSTTTYFQNRENAVWSVYSAWAATDRAAAIAYATKLAAKGDRARALSGIIDQWCAQDSSSAAAFFRSLPATERTDIYPNGLINALSATNPAEAVQMLALLGSAARKNACATIAKNWTERDLDASLKWAKSLTSPEEQEMAMDSIANVLGGQDPNKLLSTAQQISNRKLRLKFLETSTAPEHASEVLAGLPSEDACDLLKQGNVTRDIAKTDPLAAASLLAKYGNEEQQLWTITGDLYAEKDGVTALAWAKNLPPETQSAALRGVIEAMAGKDLVEDAASIQLIQDPECRLEAAKNVAQSWIRRDEAGLEAALPQLQGELRQKAQEFLLNMAIDQNPAAAARKILAMNPDAETVDSKAANDRMHYLARQWLQQSPAEAADWGRNLPEGTAKQEFVGSLVYDWADDDPLQASAWVKDLPQGASKDKAVSTLVDRINSNDPESGIIWAGQIQDQTQRESALEDSLQQLIYKDPKAAVPAIQSAQLPAETKQSLLERLREKR